MMSVKKNLTVATLAALLAVPAFGATNVSHALHIPSITAHADHYTGPWNVETYNRWKDVPGVVENQDGSGINQEIGGTIGADEDSDTNPNGDTTTKTQNGHTYVVAPYPQCPGKIISVDGQSVSSQAQILSILNNKNDQSGTQTTTTNNNNQDSTNNSSANNGSTQYSSKKSLPQTGESNDASKAMAMGAVALGASASMMALSMAKKHRQESELNSLSSEPTVDNDDGKSNEYDNGYHMIMSDTFANISKDLKQM